MVTTIDPLGNLVEVVEDKKFSNKGSSLSNKNLFTDPLGNPIKTLSTNKINFSSTAGNPKKQKEEEEGIIEKYVVDPVTAAVAGVG